MVTALLSRQGRSAGGARSQPLTALLIALLLAVANQACAASVGFQTASLPNALGRPLAVGIWYPTDAPASPRRLWAYTQEVAPDAAIAGRHLPLIVMSHGSGGWFGGHHDTAFALAQAGFVVAAVTHEGDSFDDHSREAEVWIRPLQLRQLIDYMLTHWRGLEHLDADRVGAFGFSAGAFTVLVAAGAVPDMTRVAADCEGHRGTVTCTVVAGVPGILDRLDDTPRSAWIHDARIKAIVVAAPALGFTFGKSSLASVRLPVQLWRAEFDHVLPFPDYAQAVRAALPTPPEYHMVGNADHYDFLAPCPASLATSAPEICRERPGFDRSAFHRDFDRDVVDFYRRALR